MRREVLAVALVLVAACGTAPARDTRSSKAKDADRERITAAETNVSLGQGYMEQGKLEIALEKLQRAIELDPNLPTAHTVIAVLYEQIGDNVQAEEHYRKSVSLAPKSGASNNNFGTFLCKQAKYEEADKYFERALTDPFYQTPAVALANRGACAVKWGREDLAEESLRRSLQIDAGNPTALYELAEILFRKGDHFRARAFVQRYEASAQASPESLLLALRIEEQLGNVKAARDYRNRLLNDFPESEQAQSLNGKGP
jgi:type IV pilus assembly protein PilF